MSVFEEVDNFGFVAYIGPDGYGDASFLADGGYYFFGGVLVAMVVDADVVSASGGQVGGGGSDAAAAPVMIRTLFSADALSLDIVRGF